MKQRVRYLSGVCQSWGCLLSHLLLALPAPPPPHFVFVCQAQGECSQQEGRWIWRQERVIQFVPSLPHLCLAESAAIAEPLPWLHLLPDTSFCPAMPGTQEFIFSLCLCSPEAVLTSCLSSSLSFHPEPRLTPLVFHPWIKFSLCKIFKFSLLNPEWYKISPYPFYQFF